MGKNLTEQIAEKIKESIKNNVWKPGEYIPPMRTIAETEKVSRGVITAAISVLVGEGVLESVPRHGIKVCAVKDTESDADDVRCLAKQCAEAIKKHRNANTNSCRTEDIEALREYFSGIMDEEMNSARSNSSLFISQEDALLYDKGIRCAGWSPDRYTLYKCNLSRDDSDLIRGNLLNFSFSEGNILFDSRTAEYVERRVHPHDANEYMSIMERKSLLEKQGDGEYFTTFEYREVINDTYRWIKLSLIVTREAQSADSFLYLLYQDIDEVKRQELLLKERTDEDALTGVLNRRAFMLQTEKLLSESDESRQHAFLMIDIDGFKTVNDVFGHPVGDVVLSDLSKALNTILRHGDLLGRIGGDEFVICLKDIPFDAVIEKKAQLINKLMLRDFDNGASISGSIGIAVYPRDGRTYEQLYHKMDMALYQAKENGKNRYEIYHPGMTRSENGVTIIDSPHSKSATANHASDRKKVLVVDDSETSRNIITEMIKDEYTVLQAKDGRRALLTLRRYGSSISAMLLDLIMPGMSGFDVLLSMRREPILKSIPVIIVSGDEDSDNEFRAIEMGAMDYVRKPVDKRLLKLRIKNTVNKQENERLRVQNSYLQLQGDEEQRYRYIIQNTGTIVIEHDWVNSVFTYDKVISQHLTGTYDHRSLWRILLSDMVASSMDVKIMQTMIYDLANNHARFQDSLRVKLKTITGEKHWFDMKAIKIVDGFNIANKLLITFNDINDDVVVEERLRNLVEYDSLTAIYNRSAFLEKADVIIKRSRSGVWILSVIDIDHFNVFNHLYGHEEGDRFLVYLASQLNSTVKKEGGICGRIQSDMFVVLHQSRKDRLDKFRSICKKALSDYSSSRRISSCTGRCYIDNIDDSINTILDRAMIAHRIAKSGIKKDVFFTNEMQKKLLNEQKKISTMETALNNKEFSVYFQPIYEYSTNKIVAAEALVRWITPDGKIIMPNEFIPLFEQNGFIVKLDAYVWEKACEYIRKMLDFGVQMVPISVNVSRMDIFDGNIVETIKELTNKYNIPPDLLRLEITESAYIENSEHIVKPVEELQRLGYIVEMDDFGSGFSSLNILSEVPVDILKLDMRFVLGNDRHGRKAKIMGHIINMAKSSNIEVIAEGVETQEQADFLKSLGCFNMQGYYFSKPVSSHDFFSFLRPSVKLLHTEVQNG